jgi:hypothetical protein
VTLSAAIRNAIREGKRRRFTLWPSVNDRPVRRQQYFKRIQKYAKTGESDLVHHLQQPKVDGKQSLWKPSRKSLEAR